MEEDWIGRAVSIVCDDNLGVFQGMIKDISAAEITIVRAFRNGVPLRKQNAEVVLKSSDILKIELIPTVNGEISTVAPTVINKPTPVKLPNFLNILGAKQQQELQKRQQLQRLGTSRSSDGGDGVIDYGNSTLSAKMQNMKLNSHSNGLRSTPNNSRASSVQHQTTPGGSKPSLPERSSSTTNATTPNSVALFFGGMIPPKVEVKMGTSFSSCLATSSNSNSTGEGNNAFVAKQCHNSDGDTNTNGAGNDSSGSRPIDIVGNSCEGVNLGNQYKHQDKQQMSYTNGNGNNNYGRRTGTNNNGSAQGNGIVVNGSNKKLQQQQQRSRVRRENSVRQHPTFATSVDDPLLNEDFDFEGNLALFDKRAIWNDIESTQKNPEVIRGSVRAQKQEKYRHDENVLESEPPQMRQIQTMFEGSTDFVTDEGLVIPTIPQFVRTKVELTAEKAGLSLQRQADVLARGASDLAISLLGGARRLTPNNCHQWPKIAVICDKHDSAMRTINMGAATGRQLASHGLTVLLYLGQPVDVEQSIEISLFKATDNTIVHSIDALPNPDLVILSTNTANLSEHIKKWLSENRASVLAIDPPPCGIRDVAIKYSILPILPLNGISSNNCGKLYLCNLGIPDKFYRDCGIKYKSPYGHKYVIPIHSKD